MGLDLSALPVQLTSPSICTIRGDVDAWKVAISHPPFCHPSGDPIPLLSRHLLDDLPEGNDWTSLFPDRSYEQAEYLLDPAGHRSRRSWTERERSWAYRVIHGDERFAEHATAGQGMPWRCSSADFLARAADGIEALDPETVRRDFSIAEMAADGVYKTSGTDDEDETFERVVLNLHYLARYYRRLADRDRDLLIEQD